MYGKFKRLLTAGAAWLLTHGRVQAEDDAMGHFTAGGAEQGGGGGQRMQSQRTALLGKHARSLLKDGRVSGCVLHTTSSTSPRLRSTEQSMGNRPTAYGATRNRPQHV